MQKSTFVAWCLALAGAACSAGKSAPVSLNGAGATFPYPLYSKWVAEYGKLDPQTRINYQSIGSGGGIRQISERTVDFGASDTPMHAEALQKAPGILHLPTTIGAVVLSYNLPEVTTPLTFNPEVLAAIFLGEIKTWNDPRLGALNPGVTLPARPLAVVHRSDGSGTTAVFTDYLAQVSAAWKERVGQGTSVAWPTGIGAKGNEGVTGQVKTTAGAIGYLEKAYAVQSRLPMARLVNRAGKTVEPSIDAMRAAAATFVAQIPDDLRVSIVDAPGEAAYPITSFTYILVYQEQADARRGAALAHFLWWALHEGQAFGAALDYAPLPAEVVGKVEIKLRSLRAAGQVLLAGS